MQPAIESREVYFQQTMAHFLTDLNRTQEKLSELQLQKRAALIARDLDLSQQIEQKESKLHQRLYALLERRRAILVELKAEGYAGQTIKEVCQVKGWDRNPDISALLKQAQYLSDNLQENSWGTWIFAQRASQYYGSILDIIARGGKKNAIYNRDENSQMEPGGGSLLDASI